MPKTKLTTIILIAVLLFSLSITLLQTNPVNALDKTEKITQTLSNLNLQEHKINQAELVAIQTGRGTYQSVYNYSRILNGHGTGLRPPTQDEWADIAANAYIVDDVQYGAELPTTVDLSESAWFPPIGDQGVQGSCSFFADVYYAKTYQEAKEHHWNLSQATWVGTNWTNRYNGRVAEEYQDKIMSPAFVYNLINNGSDIGGSLEAPIMVMCSIGASTWKNMPYDHNNCTIWPSEAAWAEAPYYRSNSTYLYQYIYVNETDGVSNLKNWLAAGNVATFALDAFDNIIFPENNSQDLLTLDNYINGPLDHAQTIVGYNDSITYMENGTLRTGAFKIVNSWGIDDGWENVLDGCYWMSYEVMKELSASNSPVILSQDLTDYQPEILATFNITHPLRSDCNITFGLGTPDTPIITKQFDQCFQGGDLFLGGQLPFPANNIILDLTEFKNYLTGDYNQPFYMSVFDASNVTGTINYFAIGNTTSTQTPIQTIANDSVTLTVTYSLAEPKISVSPISGPPNGQITLTGVGFTGSTLDISYLNPQSLEWITLADNLTVTSTNFTYSTDAPDLQLCNPAGDNQPLGDNFIYRVHDDGNDNTYNSTGGYTQWRRGLIQIDDQTSSGIFGNNTDLSASVHLQRGETFTVTGRWFKPGTVALLWESNELGTAVVDQNGGFTTSVTVPVSSVGQHTLTVDDGISNVKVTVTYQSTSANPNDNTETPTPSPKPSASPSVTPAIPEFDDFGVYVLVVMLIVSALVLCVTKKAVPRRVVS